MKRLLLMILVGWFSAADADPQFATVARSCFADTKQSHTDMNVIYKAFLDLQNKTVLTTFPNHIAKNIIVYKNNHVLNYSSLYQHIYSLANTNQVIKVFPFDLIVTCGNYVIAKYSVHTNSPEHVEQTRFISVFKIKDDKISKIWEIANTQQER